MNIKNYHGIEIDYQRDNLLTMQAKDLLRKFYMRDDESSPQEAFARAAICYSENIEHAQRIYDYASNLWFMFASPVLSNAVLPEEKTKALPISCFLSYMHDSLEGIIGHSTETRWLSVRGGGVGGHISNIRAVSDKSPGPIPFLHTIDADMTAYTQSRTRRASYAAYMDISHPDIEEFIHIRVPTSGGDVNRKCHNIHNAVNITDEFMNAVLEGKAFELKCPHTNEVKKIVDARKLWQELIQIRYRTGEPYLNFIDTANKFLPDVQKKIGLKINGSNLCNEIHLATDEKRTAVCCLSSLNLAHYRDWKNTSIIEDLTLFLDNVLQFFIDNADHHIEKAKYSAMQERSIGLGTLGWHTLLQKELLCFHELEADKLNEEIFYTIQSRAIKESKRIGNEKGFYLDIYDAEKEFSIEDSEKRRNAHLIAIAPNANSASIAGVSPSIEPWRSNAFVHDSRAGTHIIKNPELVSLLIAIGKNDDSVWSSIVQHDGSVQHLDFLTNHQKNVFKTAFEIDQNQIINQASTRQKYICQGQSINLFFDSNSNKAIINKIHIDAWKRGLKGLYYLRTRKSSRIEKMETKVQRQALQDFDKIKNIECNEDVCKACEG
jgi:ribonucleoside-diphosphate reductase alpha chain